MAARTITILEDDLDGKEDASVETLTFSLDGTTYEIDLSKKNREALTKALSPYLDAARKAQGTPSRRRVSSSKPGDTEAIRAWAKRNGHKVAARGRIAQSVRDAYYAAQR